jgi:hypothetical protein
MSEETTPEVTEVTEPTLPEGTAEAEINPEFAVLPESEELTEEQKAAMDSLNKLFLIKQEMIITSILDGLADKYRQSKAKAEEKVANKKGKKIYQFDAGYLKAFEEIFNSLYSFLYTVKKAEDIEPVELLKETNEEFDIFEEGDN